MVVWGGGITSLQAASWLNGGGYDRNQRTRARRCELQGWYRKVVLGGLLRRTLKRILVPRAILDPAIGPGHLAGPVHLPVTKVAHILATAGPGHCAHAVRQIGLPVDGPPFTLLDPSIFPRNCPDARGSVIIPVSLFLHPIGGYPCSADAVRPAIPPLAFLKSPVRIGNPSLTMRLFILDPAFVDRPVSHHEATRLP